MSPTQLSDQCRSLLRRRYEGAALNLLPRRGLAAAHPANPLPPSLLRDSVVALNAEKTITKKKTRSRQKKLKAYDLSTLAEFLPELEAPQKATREAEIKLNSKSRKKLILREGKQLSRVFNHPAFQSDPLDAIHQHLQSTQPVLNEQPKKKANKNGGKKAKRKKSNAGTESMEF